MCTCYFYPQFFLALFLPQCLRGGKQTGVGQLLPETHCPVYIIKATWWDPWRHEGKVRLGRDGEEAKAKKKRRYRSWRRRKKRVENGRQKTMRQNQKINEALFQQQDLCTVNITLAISGNPITLHLSFLFWQGTGGGEAEGKRKSEGCAEIRTEREQEERPRDLLCLFSEIEN